MKTHLAKIVMAFVAVIFGSLDVLARPEINVEADVWNMYLNNAEKFLDKPVFQTRYSIRFPSDMALVLFHSVGLDDSDLSSNFGDEIDLTISKTQKFGSMKHYSLKLELAYWDCHKLLTSRPVDVIYNSVALSRSLCEFATGTILYETYATTDQKIMDGGYRASAKVEVRAKVTDYLSVIVAPAIVRDDGAFHLSPSWVLGSKVFVRYTFDKVSFDLIKMRIDYPFSKPDDGRKTVVAWGTGLSFSF